MSPSSRILLAAGVALALTLGAAGCGSDSPTAPKTLGLSIAAGGGQSDTVLSTLPQALVMQLNEVGGVGGHVVQFSTLGLNGVYAYVHREDSNVPVTFAVDTTSAVGRVEMQVVLGRVAGAASILVAVPDFGISDTVTFTATPGALAGIGVSPKDTAVMVGNTATLRGGAVDSYGNVRSDPVTFSVLSGPVTVSGANVTGTAVGPASVLVAADSKVDTAYLSVVPVGTLAAGYGGVIRIFNLDGSSMETVPTATRVGMIRWAPSGASLVYDQTDNGGSGGSSLIQTVTTGGVVTVVDNSPGLFDQWPSWSRDGSTIYYSKINDGSGSAIWQVTPSGTNDDSVTTQDPSFDILPSPSPDGTQLAYIADLSSSSDLRVLTLATGAVTDLHIEAWAPVWSPAGQQIAYLTQTNYSGQIAVANSDGSGQRVLNSNSYWQPFDWSSDGQYLVAVNATTDQMELITVSTGATLPLGFTGYYSPTWKPGSGSSASRVPTAAPRAKAPTGRRRHF